MPACKVRILQNPLTCELGQGSSAALHNIVGSWAVGPQKRPSGFWGQLIIGGLLPARLLAERECYSQDECADADLARMLQAPDRASGS